MKRDRICTALLAVLELLMILGILILTGWLVYRYISFGQQAAKVEDGQSLSGNGKDYDSMDSADDVANHVMKLDLDHEGEVALAGSEPLSIRVQLLTENFQSEYHDRIELTSEDSYLVTWYQVTEDEQIEVTQQFEKQGGETFSLEKKEIGAGRFLSIYTVHDAQEYSQDNSDGTSNEIADETPGKNSADVFSGNADSGPENDRPLRILSFQRADGYPEYAGTLFIYPEEDGLVLINELPLETYLSSVVSSEMPSYYPLEAQKAQSVCARTYAWRHMEQRIMNEQSSDTVTEESELQNEDAFAAENVSRDSKALIVECERQSSSSLLASSTADLDDSVMYQVYNNYRSSELSEEAVRLTAGEILNVEEPLYYSTSCLSECRTDLGDEEAFAAFLEDVPQEQEEYGSAWLRWEVTLSKEKILERAITYYPEFGEKIQKAGTANEENHSAGVQTAETQEAGTQDTDTQSTDIASAELQETDSSTLTLCVLERSPTGQVQRLLLSYGSAEQIVEGEYLIRCVLGTQETEILLMDGSTVTNMKLLPSAFFILGEKNLPEDDTIEISGGGYGHGIGMSQCGAAQMASEGSDYQEILAYYYGEEAEAL